MGKKVVIIGGGAAGMAAAIAAGENGNNVHLYEKNEKLGKKLYITGKGRCNLTNACDIQTMLDNVVTNPRFLYSSFYNFTNKDIIDLLEQNGCPVKFERGNRVFPASDKSSDVISALTGKLKRTGTIVHLNEEAESLKVSNGRCCGVRLTSGKDIDADAVVVATGGLSYPATGSTGDGYRFAKDCGIDVTDTRPALVPLNVKEDFVKDLQGLSLKNVEVSFTDGKKELFRGFGEMLFTHFGVSGPIILSASSFITKYLKNGPVTLSIDLKPAISEEQLDARILRDFSEFSNRHFDNSLNKLYPSKLIPVIIKRSGIDPEKRVNEITKEERARLLDLTKHFTMTVTSPRGFDEAVITQGGVSVKEIDPKTMESKKVKGLYFAGEVLDVDAVTGGFNLQIAWSTGWACGSYIDQLKE